MSFSLSSSLANNLQLCCMSMEEGPSNTSAANDQPPFSEHSQVSPPRTNVDQQSSVSGQREDHPAPSQPEEALYDFTREEEDAESTATPWVEGQASSRSPEPTSDQSSQDKGKEKEQGMSYPGDYYHSGMARTQYGKATTTSTTIDRRPDASRSSTSSSSNASTPKQSPEEARGDNKKGGSGSTGASGGAAGSGSGSSRSRLVAGVFVRY